MHYTLSDVVHIFEKISDGFSGSQSISPTETVVYFRALENNGYVAINVQLVKIQNWSL